MGATACSDAVDGPLLRWRTSSDALAIAFTLRAVSVHCFSATLTSTGSLIGLVARGALLAVARGAVLAVARRAVLAVARRAVLAGEPAPETRRAVLAGVLASASGLMA
jgi:hypothetical protein